MMSGSIVAWPASSPGPRLGPRPLTDACCPLRDIAVEEDLSSTPLFKDLLKLMR